MLGAIISFMYIVTFSSTQVNYFPLTNLSAHLNYNDFIPGISLIDAIPSEIWKIKEDVDDFSPDLSAPSVYNSPFFYPETILSLQQNAMFSFQIPNESFYVSEDNGNFLSISPYSPHRIYAGYSGREIFYGYYFKKGINKITFSFLNSDAVTQSHFFFKTTPEKNFSLSLWGGEGGISAFNYSGGRISFSDTCCKFNRYKFSTLLNFFGRKTTETPLSRVEFSFENRFVYSKNITITASILYSRDYFAEKNFLWNFNTFLEMNYVSEKSFFKIFLYHLSSYPDVTHEKYQKKESGVGAVVKLSKRWKNLYFFLQENLSYFYSPFKNEVSHFYIESGYKKKFLRAGFIFVDVKEHLNSLKFHSGDSLFRGSGFLISSRLFSNTFIETSLLFKKEEWQLYDMKLRIIYRSRKYGIAVQSILNQERKFRTSLSGWWSF